MAARSQRAKDAGNGNTFSAETVTHGHASAAESTPDRVTWSLFLKAALLVTAIWAASALVLYLTVQDFSKSGTFGDSFGVLNTLFSGLAFAGIIVTIKMQNDEMREQRKELQKQKKAAQVYHRERMFLMLMDEFKKSREHRFSIADVRLVLRECLCDVAALNARSAEVGRHWSGNWRGCLLVRRVKRPCCLFLGGAYTGTNVARSLSKRFGRRQKAPEK